MKIKRRDLAHLIREMAIDEMAYMGMPNIQKGKPRDRQPNKYDKKKYHTEISKLEKFFKTSKFAKNATKFYGEDRGFPGSNVWIIPQVGDPRSDELQFDKEEPGYDPDKYRTGAFLATPDRGSTYNISEKLLKSLGMSEEGIASVNFTNDIIFVPRATNLFGDKYNFVLPTTHMIIHALFDGGALSKLPEVKRAMILAARQQYDAASPGGEVAYWIPEINPSEGFVGLFAPVTASLRRGFEAQADDVANEILTGALLYRRVLEKITAVPKYEEYLREKTGMGVKELINSAIEASRKFLKGKIVIVDVV